MGPARTARPAVHGSQLGRSGIDAVRDRRTEGQAPGGHRRGRRDLVPRFFRAGGRIGSRLAAYPRRPRWRRLAHHRPEGVDVLRPDGIVVRARHLHRPRRAKTQAAHAFSDPHGPGRFHGAADPVDAGTASPQRDVPRRCAGLSRRRPRRARRRLAGNARSTGLRTGRYRALRPLRIADASHPAPARR